MNLKISWTRVRSVLTVDTEVNVNGMTAGPNVKKSDGIIIVEGLSLIHI